MYEALLQKLPAKQGPNKPWHPSRLMPCAIVAFCTSCKQYLPITSFYEVKNKTSRGRKTLTGKPRLSTCGQCQVKKYVSIDHRLKLLYSARRHAREKGIECTLTVEDIRIPTHCPVLGFKLEPKVGEGRQGCRNFERSPSIDRIDNTKAYTPDNICVISARANHLKSNSTVEEVEAVLNYMKEGHKKYAFDLLKTNDTTVPEEGV